MTNQILKGEWNELKGEIQKSWGQLTDSEIDQIDGEATRLEGLLQQKYGHTLEEAREKITAVIDRYDDLSFKGEWNEVKGKIQKFWGELTDDEVEKVNGSRTRLLGLIQQRYAKSRMKALEEVKEFLKS